MLGYEGFLNNLRVGRRFFVKYTTDKFWHERLTLWPVHRRAWAVLTPDGDIFVEEADEEEQYGAIKEGGTRAQGLRGAFHRLSSPMRDHILMHNTMLGRAEAQVRRESADPAD